jgi:hypothetical protein
VLFQREYDHPPLLSIVTNNISHSCVYTLRYLGTFDSRIKGPYYLEVEGPMAFHPSYFRKAQELSGRYMTYIVSSPPTGQISVYFYWKDGKAAS